jgi:3-isopropylmalate dehydrogenase
MGTHARAVGHVNATIAVLPGDGVGPEVTTQAVRALLAIGERHDHRFTIVEGAIGGAAIDDSGDPLPPATRELVQSADAVLLGAVGGPQWSDPTASVRPEQGLLGLRGLLGTFANIRPVSTHPSLRALSPLRPELLEGVDILFVRELTGGLYFGEKTVTRDESGRWQRATDLCVYTADEVARVVRMAAAFARERRGKLTSVDKANVLETSRLWRAVTTDIMRHEFPDVTIEHVLVDAFAMHLLRSPASYDVVVTENLFGDILTDEAAAVAGSIGLLPSASLGSLRADGRVAGLYEPIHGSAPDIAGRSIANPAGAILSVALLLRYTLGLERAALELESAVNGTLRAGLRTADCVGDGDQAISTTAFGDAVIERLG